MRPHLPAVAAQSRSLTTLNGVTNEFDGQLTSKIPRSFVGSTARRRYAAGAHLSLTGSITMARLTVTAISDLLQISVDKPAEIEAGQNILNLAFLGENLRDDDVTSIIAGRDISDSTNLASPSNFVTPALVIGGPAR